ncbi:MAG: tol-pal system-associated acyl-CoA thioesterase [Pseudomonadota bacterium]
MASSHVFPVRVYYEDTDAAGIVYYANYLKFAERARTEMLRAAGIGGRALAEDSGVAFAVRRCAAEYLAPARLDDLLEVHTRVTRVRGAWLEAEQIVRRDGRDIARLTLVLACRGRGGRPVRLPAQVVRALDGASKSVPPAQRDVHG